MISIVVSLKPFENIRSFSFGSRLGLSELYERLKVLKHLTSKYVRFQNTF